ncbi:MAG: UDP-N-acetylmuramoyl-L-alanine--D-glutamate ligase [Prochlorococcus marinus CUG1439]|uniref:UDP-N-acetylmuramoyl-L-alanine--D-glutamate ligase n=1 Tax=Prochlorococcus sp. MIT 1314 TaxID=3096220 RepID=UPI001B109CEE|nr:UDP-N-acetylmuramoyl-L-alanine--D-glutamate ligase [Prochlorococcus sp. MIT 1314]MCR8538929.1 UDP-N-acetylmuramoyl-L-alanine--D-glutamate ligase [Prochlorococcus marinus CUG1439]
MINNNHLSKRKNINLVIGLGKSGFWAAKYLKRVDKRVIVWESKDGEKFLEAKKELEELNILVCLKKEFVFEEIDPFVKEIESVVISPSIPYDHETIIKLKKKGIKVIGEINVAWEILKDTNWIGITGTNGKTTVTHLLSHILCENELYAPFAGNIGTPLCKYAYSKKHKKLDWVVAEISSYQIEISPEVKPNIGIWTTFTEDHLERHKTLENYFNIKKSLLEKSDFRIYNYDDENLRNHYSSLSKGVWITTSLDKSNLIQCDYWVDDNAFIVEKGKRLFKLEHFPLKGMHNLQNLLLVIAAARKVGLSGKKIKYSLSNYRQLPHRMETIYKNNDLEIINDSKATNFDSSIAGIDSIEGQIILISGGRLKGNKYTEWIKVLKKKVKCIFLFGESSKVLKMALINEGFKKDIFEFPELKELLTFVFQYLQNNKGGTLLFSPSCSSFDQFKNYEERGDHFKKLISEKLKIN